MDVFRRAILIPGPPEGFALQTVQQVIRPQRGSKLIQDENQLLENIMRTLLQELVSAAVDSGEEIMQYGQLIADGDFQQGQIPRLLDMVLYLCEKENIEGGMIFQLLEDLTEMSTMRNCKDVFGYIEGKQDILGKPELFTRGKLVMLRTCNQLLRRLSKANDVVFCGRIIMFLAHFFPLSERSAVNSKGVFNASNVTKYEKEAPDGSSIDFNFYKTFWSLQESFSNPASLIPAIAKWHKFTSSLAVVLSTYEAQPLNDEEANAINLEDETSSFSIKYLTSSKLMGLEIKDPSFRRHVLVQCLILFDYLKAPGKNDKDLPSDAIKEDVRTFEERVKKLLIMTPPRGKDFLRGIEHILERERNWVWWKRDGCHPFEKEPIERNPAQDGGRKRTQKRLRLGNKELHQLWRWADQNKDVLTDKERVETPDVMAYWKPLAEDMDESAGIEEEYHHKNNRVYCWKGLRISARQDLEGFSRFTEHGIEGVVPIELLPADVRSKYQAKPADRTKRAKKEDTKSTVAQAEIASEKDIKRDPESSSIDVDSVMVAGESDENQKQNSDENDEAEAGMIDGETEDVDLDVIA